MESMAKIKNYARKVKEPAYLAWIDGSKREYTAIKAVALCEVRITAACIMGAECEDKKLEQLLNALLDRD